MDLMLATLLKYLPSYAIFKDADMIALIAHVLAALARFGTRFSTLIRFIYIIC